MNKMKFCAAIVLLLCLSFVALDIVYGELSVDRGELWGPVSAFHPLVKWMWIVATVFFCLLVLYWKQER